MAVYLYLHINPTTNKPFYVGIGRKRRAWDRNRNRYHRAAVQSFRNQSYSVRILHLSLSLERAHTIEKQIISKCGRICNNTGYLTNIHHGGALEHTVGKPNWRTGKTMRELHGEEWISWRKGKTYKEIFGDRAQEISERAARNRSTSLQQRLSTTGLTEKQKQGLKRTHQRRANKEFTQNELDSFKRTSERQKDKSMKERLRNPNYASSNKGRPSNRTPPNKGKKARELYGEDFIDSRSKPFKIISSLGEQIFNNEAEFLNVTKLSAAYITKFKKYKSICIKRRSDSQHSYPHMDTLIFEYA